MRAMDEFTLTPPPEPLTRETFRQRFVARMMAAATPHHEFHSDADIEAYAKETADLYWQERTDETPEECADEDLSCWDW